MKTLFDPTKRDCFNFVDFVYVVHLSIEASY